MLPGINSRNSTFSRTIGSDEETERLLGGGGGRHKRSQENKSRDTTSNSSNKSKSPRKLDKKSSKSKDSDPQKKKSHDKKKKKKDKEEKSKDGVRKRKSSQKPLSKGLSPPKERPQRKTEEYSKSDSGVTGTFDQTQWERTRWGAMYSTERTEDSRMRRTGPMTTLGGGGQTTGKVEESAVGSGVPGEGRQEERVRGEHLKARPKIHLIVLGIEAAFCAMTMTVWGAAAVNPMLPFILALINLLFIFSIICTVFAVEIFRFQVKKVEADEEIGGKTKHTTKFRIPYRWRFWLLGCHMARAILLCACITIMALDNDFDAGSIAVLALQPFHLIVVAIQIFIVLRPKRKE